MRTPSARIRAAATVTVLAAALLLPAATVSSAVTDATGVAGLIGEPATPTPSGGLELAAFRAGVLTAHNEYRARHQVPELQLSEQVTAFAQEWADQVAARDQLGYRPNSPYGENLYYATSTDPAFRLAGRDPVRSWYEQSGRYTAIYGRDPSDQEFNRVGGFTQLVWRESRRIGVGYAVSATRRHYVVVSYDPPGNVAGGYRANVPRIPAPSPSPSPATSPTPTAVAPSPAAAAR